VVISLAGFGFVALVAIQQVPGEADADQDAQNEQADFHRDLRDPAGLVRSLPAQRQRYD
jgi:hypothetical protein